MSQRLIAAIVPHGRGEEVSEAANRAGAGGGTILSAQGTAPNAVLQLLGLGTTSREIYFTVVDATREAQVEGVVRAAAAARGGRTAGVIFAADVARFVRFGLPETTAKEENAMENATELVGVIVNKGYAEDAMAAARKAGASGGTILGARGTASEADARFFGVKLVPEKELLLILAPVAVAEAVFQAVRALPCFAEKGSGIEFSVPVRDFTALGR